MIQNFVSDIDIEHMISQWSANWCLFQEEVLGEDLWGKQQAIVRSVQETDRTTVRSCHSSGKTRTASDVILSFLVLNLDSIVVTTAPTWIQVKNVLWREIHRAYRSLKWPIVARLMSTGLDIAPNWYAIGISTNETDRLQGFHSPTGRVLVVVDEASGVTQELFDAIEGLLSAEHAKLLLLGNPTENSGEFYESHKPNSGYTRIHIAAKDTPNFQGKGIVRPYLISPKWVDRMKVKWGENNPLYVSRIHGEFPDQGEDTLIRLSWIEKAVAQELMPQDPVILSVDVARFGSNKTVYALRRGPVVRFLRKTGLEDTQDTADRVLGDVLIPHTVKIPTKQGEEIVWKDKSMRPQQVRIDIVGVGSGVYDRLYRLKREKAALKEVELVPVHSGARAIQNDIFGNARAENYWQLRERFEAGEIDIERDEDLSGQLAALKYRSSSAKIWIEDKNDLRKRGLPSPDEADSLMMAYARWEDRIFGVNVVSRDLTEDERRAKAMRVPLRSPTSFERWKKRRAS